jgi:hypothetical protein
MQNTVKNLFSFIIISIIILIFFYYYFKYDYKDKLIKINKEIVSESDYKYEYIDSPNLRGLTREYQFKNRAQEGGSKAFINNFILDDSNLNINQVNFTNESTYRKTPLTLNDLNR